MRIVRSPEGAVCLDRGTRRSPGRGAYLCSEEGCLRKAQRALSRALRVPVSDALLGELAEHAALRRRCAESDRPADSGGAADS